MIADRLFEEGTVPEWTTAEWYQGREVAPHLEQAGHRERLQLGARLLQVEMQGWGDVSVSDLGAGDGGFLTLLPSTWTKWGYELSPTAIAAATARGVTVSYRDIVTQRDYLDIGQVVVMQEVLEHLLNPHEYLTWLARDGRCDVLLASSPFTERQGNAYEFHTWAWDEQGYRRMLEDCGWRLRYSDKAWICQVVVAVRA